MVALNPKFKDITFSDIDRLRLGGHWAVRAPKSSFVALVDGRSNPGVFIHPHQPDSDAVIQSEGRFSGPFESRDQAEKFLASKA